MSATSVLHTTLSISGASCQGCAKKIRNALEPLTGDAELVEVNLEDQTVALPEGIDATEAARIVTETGYPAEPVTEAVLTSQKHRAPERMKIRANRARFKRANLKRQQLLLKVTIRYIWR
jgi:copper chaperone CopZ